MAGDDLMEYILIHYRWVFVCFFLLPLSIVYDMFNSLRNAIVFKMSSAPHEHSKKVQGVQKQIHQWIKNGRKVQMCTARPGWQTMSFRSPKYKHTLQNIALNMVDILEVNEEKGTIKLEPLVTMGQLTATIAPLGWTLPIVPELDDLTVGGMVMGTGIESSSHKYGLFQHICVSYELVLADGSLVTCSKEENPDLFASVPWSYGTLGFLTAVEMQLIPATKYVHLKYQSFNNIDKFITEIDKSVSEGHDFIEGIMFGLNQAVLMTGGMADKAEDQKINPIGKWYKPWFFKHVQSIHSSTSGEHEEYIPLRDYYHRHSRSIFWELQDIIPFGNNIFFRYLLGWAVPPKISLMKLTQTSATKKLYERNHMIQDMLVPIKAMKDSFKKFDDLVGIYPVWVCPFKLTDEPGMVHSKRPTEMFVDIGVYGVPKKSGFDPARTTRTLEEFVRKVGGFQMLYADTYMTEEEFREMFDHTLYDKMRKTLKCEDAFPSIYGKVNKTVRD